MDLGSKQTYAVHKVELNLRNTDPRHIHRNQPSSAVSARVEGIKDAKLGIIKLTLTSCVWIKRNWNRGQGFPPRARPSEDGGGCHKCPKNSRYRSLEMDKADRGDINDRHLSRDCRR